MPTYEFRCRTCDERFELRRPMAEADSTAPCPAGHADTVRLLASFATTGRSSSSPVPAAVSSGGGGCGGACACAH